MREAAVRAGLLLQLQRRPPGFIDIVLGVCLPCWIKEEQERTVSPRRKTASRAWDRRHTSQPTNVFETIFYIGFVSEYLIEYFQEGDCV